GDRARFHHRDRLLLRHLDGHDAAVRAHDVNLAAEGAVAQMVLQAFQIAFYARPDEGVERSGRGALVFAVFAQNLVRQRDEEVWTRLAQDFAHTALMRGVRIGVEEADRDGFHPFRVELREDVLHGLFIERLEHFAGSEDAFRHFERQVARDQWFGALEEEIEGFDAVIASDGVDIAKAPGGQERRARAL